MNSVVIFPTFKQGTETWDSYLRHFEYYLDANNLANIPPSKKKSYFLSLCGSAVFDTAVALLAPREESAVPWDELQEVLGNHYSPKPSIIARRHAFRRRVQKGESINDFMAALRTAALHCGFREFLEDVLLDQLVGGVRDLKLQRRLLARGKLNLTTAVEEATAAELADVSAAEMQGKDTSGSKSPAAAVHHEEVITEGSDEESSGVHRLIPPASSSVGTKPVSVQTPRFQQICLSCGGNHPRVSCRFQNLICLTCKRKGHIARVCQARTNPMQVREVNPRPNQQQQRQVETCYTCYHANTQLNKPSKISVTVSLEGRPCKMEVDTGSALSIISWKTIKQILPHFRKQELQNQEQTNLDDPFDDVLSQAILRTRYAPSREKGVLCPGQVRQVSLRSVQGRAG